MTVLCHLLSNDHDLKEIPIWERDARMPLQYASLVFQPIIITIARIEYI